MPSVICRVDEGLGLEPAVDEEESVQAVLEASRLGINFFDTSPFYGCTRSETVLGRALSLLHRDQIVIATKVGRYGDADFDFSEARVFRSVHESMARLQTNYLDVVQVHDIEFGNLDQIVTETLPALHKLKVLGLIRAVGITGLPLSIFRKVLDRVPVGTVDLVLSYCHYNLLDSTLEEVVPYLQSKGVGIVNASILGMGLLTPQGPPAWHPAGPELRRAAALAQRVAEEHHVPLTSLCVEFAVPNPAIACSLVGLATRQHVQAAVVSALRALGLQPLLDPAARARVMDAVQAVLRPVQGQTWHSGRPENS
ncbi:aldo/keto reductase [Helicosporidium sp. ATCC 50920]|nr:aldo/keto reductase [Helicosporidium sp. ATCC 50920]|eukprot:KDD76386.1 aldo/keto reductase [Helicosporidium sp. ATCC 50920]